MTDKEYREQKKRVQKYIDKWFDTLGMGWYDMHFNWSRTERDDNIKLRVAADTNSLWEYKRAYINWYLPCIADLDESSLENVVIHEFAHVLVASVEHTDLPPERLEYATESVTRALEWTRRAGSKDK